MSAVEVAGVPATPVRRVSSRFLRSELRLVTWSPLYEPHSLLSLVFASDGALSRYSNDDVDALIDAVATFSLPHAADEFAPRTGALPLPGADRR